jgi:hypothetical protein
MDRMANWCTGGCSGSLGPYLPSFPIFDDERNQSKCHRQVVVARHAIWVGFTINQTRVEYCAKQLTSFLDCFSVAIQKVKRTHPSKQELQGRLNQSVLGSS